MGNSSFLQINNLTTVIKTRTGDIKPVDNVSIEVPPNTTVGLVGESGCGKSMTALSIMGLLPNTGHVDSGSIMLGDTDLTKLSQKQMRAIRGDRICMIFQEPMTSLNPVITAGKQVREALILHRDISKAEAGKKVVDIFRQVGIPEPEKRFKAFPHELSGGLRQRVMIGMAMISEPDLLIADEPTTALDVTIEAQILHLMRQLRNEHGTSILMITHNMGVVAEICDTVYVMYAGQVVEHCDVYKLFKNAMHPYSVGLLGALPSVDKKQRLVNIPGMVPTLANLPEGCRFADRCSRAAERCRKSMPSLHEAEPGHLVRCFEYGSEAEK